MRYRNCGLAVLATLMMAYVADPLARAQADAKSTSVLAEMRKALGGEKKLAEVKALSLRADYRREMGAPAGPGGGTTFVMMGGGGGGTFSGPGAGGQATGKIEIDLELPDKYLRSDVGTAAFGMTRTEGFESSRPFIELVPNSPGMRVQTDNPAADPARAQAALRRQNADLARLLIALTGTAQPGFAVTFAHGGIAESPDGKADIIDVAGPDNFKAKLFVDVETHLPLMLTYMDAEPRMITRTLNRDGAPGGQRGSGTVVVGGGRGEGRVGGELTPEQRAEIEKQRKEMESTPPKMVEYQIFLADHRKVDGVSLPHSISRGASGKTTEEWTVTAYKVNPTFKAERFKVGS